MTIYVDSNYWIYWMDKRHLEHSYVTRTMRAAIREGILLNLTSLLEVAHYFRNLGEAELVARMDKLRNLTTLSLTDLDAATAQEEGCYKWRIEDYRVIYTIDERRRVVTFAVVDHQSRMYKHWRVWHNSSQTRLSLYRYRQWQMLGVTTPGS